ncbi:MAG: glutamate-cysteine ligase family protein, partial [Micromonosporaceae bacterium]
MGRDVAPVRVSREDRRRYRDKVHRCLDVLARMLQESQFEFDRPHIGLEIELNLVDTTGHPLMRNSDVLDAIADPAWATELGRFNLEINVPPRELGGVAELEREVRDSLNQADERARQVGGELMLIGILPTLRESHVSEDVMSANDRYKLLNEQIFATRGEDMR